MGKLKEIDGKMTGKAPRTWRKLLENYGRIELIYLYLGFEPTLTRWQEPSSMGKLQEFDGKMTAKAPNILRKLWENCVISRVNPIVFGANQPTY